MSVRYADNKTTSWGGVLLGILPILLFGSAYLIKAAYELGSLPGWPAGLVRTTDLIAYGIISFGLALCWLKGFPGWSLPYVGTGLLLGWMTSQSQIYGVRYGVQGWLPFLTGLAVGALISRSLLPPFRLIRSIWWDWTRLSFIIYAGVLPLMTIVFTDGDFGNREVLGLAADTLLLAVGAAVYLRSQTTLIKAASLQGTMILLTLRGFLMVGWFGGPENLKTLSPDVLVRLFIMWGGLLLIPGLLGLLRRGLTWRTYGGGS